MESPQCTELPFASIIKTAALIVLF